MERDKGVDEIISVADRTLLSLSYLIYRLSFQVFLRLLYRSLNQFESAWRNPLLFHGSGRGCRSRINVTWDSTMYIFCTDTY